MDGAGTDSSSIDGREGAPLGRASNRGKAHRPRTAREPGEIYLVTNRVNGKKYVGQAYSLTRDGKPYGTRARWTGHLGDARAQRDGRRDARGRGCHVLNAAIIKHGEECFDVEVIMRCGADLLDSYEATFIDAHNTLVKNGRGYNLKSGGNGNGRADESTRKLMSEAHAGENHPMFGKHHTAEARKKISDRNLGKVRYDVDGTTRLPNCMKYEVDRTRVGYVIYSHPLVVRPSAGVQSRVRFFVNTARSDATPSLLDEQRARCIRYLDHLDGCAREGTAPLSKDAFFAV